MKLQDALGIPRGITSVIGGGGKTTLLSVLARELACVGATVALTTSTHFLPFEGMPALSGPGEWDTAASPIACFASPTEEGKLTVPVCGIPALAEAADYVLVEADGSKRLPLKAHADWEPAVPAGSKRCVLVLGGSGFGRPVREAVHRPELFCELAGCESDADATPKLVAAAIAAETASGRIAPDVVVVNQAEDPRVADAACAFAGTLHAHGVGAPVLAGSIRDAELFVCG